jgi:hypothetical protein
MLRNLFFLLLFSGLLPTACKPSITESQEAFLEEGKGNTTQALYGYDVALRKNPKDSFAHKRKGILLSNHIESWGVAIWHLEKALEIAPNDEEVRKELFFLYLATENWLDSEKMVHYWKLSNQGDSYLGLEALYNCETRINRLKPYSDIVNNSDIIPDFWKKRCSDRASK